jgi:hypothetical protein
VDADIAGAANQIVHHRTVQDLEPARALGFADDDLRHIVGLGVIDHVGGDVAGGGGERDGLATERLGKPERVGDTVTLLLRELKAAPSLDVKRYPWSMQAVGQSLGVADEPGAARIVADADEDALARRPGTLDGVRLHFREQLFVHSFGGAAQSELAQRGEVGG